MPELRISIDSYNPGQFYACCGLAEMFDLSGAQALSQFQVDYRHPHDVEFVLTSESELNLDFIVQSIREAEFSLNARRGTNILPEKDSVAPVSISLFQKDFKLDWWLDEFHERATALKCWAGQLTTQKLITELTRLLPSGNVSFDADGFTSTRFGIDPRSAWVALNLGYSPNEQGQDSRTYPVVELLAAVGLQGFRPAGDRTQGFRYALWLEPLPLMVARTASVRPWEGLAIAQYKFELGERGSYKFFCFADPILS